MSKPLSYPQVEFLGVSRLISQCIFILHWNRAEVFQLFSMKNPEKKKTSAEQNYLRLRPCAPVLHSWNCDFNLENFVALFLYILHEYKETFNFPQNFPCGLWYLYWNEKQCQNHLLLKNVVFILSLFFSLFLLRELNNIKSISLWNSCRLYPELFVALSFWEKITVTIIPCTMDYFVL